jgi:S1-C subfamily serine protease
MRFHSLDAWSAAIALLVVGCASPRPATPARAARSFEPYAGRSIGDEPVKDFFASRTAVIVGGVQVLGVHAKNGTLDGETRYVVPFDVSLGGGADKQTLSFGSAAALTLDGYFATAAHCVAIRPVHVALQTEKGVVVAEARVVHVDEARDFALVHAKLAPVKTFTWMGERILPAGAPLLSYAPVRGGAAGNVEVVADFASLAPYGILLVPHDTPLAEGFSGGPAVTLDGELVGVNTKTGRDSIFVRRSWLARPEPREVEKWIAEDRRPPDVAASRPAQAESRPTARVAGP